jgi:FAD/FMN-containing dehydrogenase
MAGNDMLRLCVEVGGCLTGEHGVGIEKRDLMTDQFNPPICTSRCGCALCSTATG